MIRSGTYPVAMIPYINMAPYRRMGAPLNCHFVSLVPKMSIAALQRGSVLAAAVPVGGLLALNNIVEVIGQFGIAAKRESMSVMFFSDRPFDAMNSACTIRLTGDSASSVRLLYLLWNKLLGENNLPELAAADQPVNGELLIGDQALKRAVAIKRWKPLADKTEKNATQPFPVVTDLAALWRQLYNLPFVFARWVVRKDADERVKMTLRQWLEDFRRKETDLVAACIEPAARLLNIDEALAKRYFQVIHRCLDHRDLIGQERFITELKKVHRDPLFSPAHGKNGV